MVERIILPTWNHASTKPKRFLQFYIVGEREGKLVNTPYIWCSHNLINQTGESEMELIRSLESRIVFLGTKRRVEKYFVPTSEGKNYRIVGSGEISTEKNGKIINLLGKPETYPLSVSDEHIKALNSYLDSIQQSWRRFTKA